jgi:hypothetical protein
VRRTLEDSSLDFHDLSWTDPAGRLFWRDGNLFRGIREPQVAFYRELLAKETIHELVERKLLVDTWTADISTEEFPLVVQHRVLPVISFPSEWCAGQLKAAALMILDLEMALRRHNSTLIDVNPWNVLFDGGRPLFVDLGSIAPLSHKSVWKAREEFRRFYLNPLLLFGKGLPRIARRLLCDPWVGITDLELARMNLGRKWAAVTGRAKGVVKLIIRVGVPLKLRPALRVSGQLWRRNWQVARRGRDLVPVLSVMRDKLQRMPVLGPKTQWAGYYLRNFPELTPSDRWTAKHHAIFNIIEKTRPKSLLDIGANRGWYSQLAASKGVRVVAADTDERALNELYGDAISQRLEVSTIFMDVRFPEPAQGPAYKFFSPATERFRSEMVLGLAIVHHLVFTWHLSFDQIVDALDAFSSKWLVVEFVGSADGVVKRLWNHARFPWYNLENFSAAITRRYRIVEQFHSDSGGLDAGPDTGPDDRTVLLCEKTVRVGPLSSADSIAVELSGRLAASPTVLWNA